MLVNFSWVNIDNIGTPLKDRENKTGVDLLLFVTILNELVVTTKITIIVPHCWVPVGTQCARR